MKKEQSKGDINWAYIREDQGLIVLAACWLFDKLSYLSLFKVIRFINKEKCTRYNIDEEKSFIGGSNFPELWVLLNILNGIVIYILLALVDIPCWLKWVIMVPAIARAFEIMVYHINVLLFDPLKSASKEDGYAIKSSVRMLILLLINMFEYVICFSIVYLCCIPGINDSFIQSFSTSIYAFLNINIPDDKTVLLSNTWLTVARMEAILGVLMNLICIARFINMLPSVETKEKQNKKEDKKQK